MTDIEIRENDARAVDAERTNKRLAAKDVARLRQQRLGVLAVSASEAAEAAGIAFETALEENDDVDELVALEQRSGALNRIATEIADRALSASHDGSLRYYDSSRGDS